MQSLLLLIELLSKNKYIKNAVLEGYWKIDKRPNIIRIILFIWFIPENLLSKKF